MKNTILVLLMLFSASLQAERGFHNRNSLAHYGGHHGKWDFQCYKTEQEACVNAPFPDIFWGPEDHYIWEDNPPSSGYHSCGSFHPNGGENGTKSFSLIGSAWILTCDIKNYYLSESPPKKECGFGNPVAPSSGLKFQSFVDLRLPGINYSWMRYYRSNFSSFGEDLSSSWKHNFETHFDDIRAVERPVNFVRSELHTTAQAACDSWVDRQLTYQGGIYANSTSSLASGDICEISKAGAIVTRIPVLHSQGGSARARAVLNDTAVTKTIIRPDGNTYIFKSNAGEYYEVNGAAVKLDLVESDWFFTDKDGSVDKFVNGLLASRTLPNGQELTIERDENERMIGVRFGTREVLSIAYNPLGKISTVTAGTNRVDYSYGTYKDLVSVSKNQGPASQYHYEDSNYSFHLTGITDERGVRYATWAYDAEGRAISSEHAGSKEKFLFDYSELNNLLDPRTTVTFPLGKKSIFHYAIVGGQRQVAHVEGEASENCAAADQYKTYYANGSLQTKTDWMGNVTYYERDVFGRTNLMRSGYRWSAQPQSGVVGEVLSLLEAPTNESDLIETKTCWHSTYSKPVRVITADLVTNYNYDANGRLTSELVEAKTAANAQCQ